MQAARGTPVDHPEDGADEPRPVRVTRRSAWLLFAAVAVVAYAVDQVTKRQAVQHLTGRDDIRIVGEVLQLHLTYNPGAAFSLGTRFTVGLTCLAILATLAILWFSRRLGHRGWALGLGLILAGIDGNLTDRMLREPGPFRGHVVDFLMLPNWPVFNVADMCINVAAVLIVILSFKGIGLDGSIDGGAADESEGEPEGEKK